jgi:hypothetical protein
VPRSDSNRAPTAVGKRHKRGLREVQVSIIQALRAAFQNFGHETRVWTFLNRRSHHPGAGRASARPSSA